MSGLSSKPISNERWLLLSVLCILLFVIIGGSWFAVTEIHSADVMACAGNIQAFEQMVCNLDESAYVNQAGYTQGLWIQEVEINLQTGNDYCLDVTTDTDVKKCPSLSAATAGNTPTPYASNQIKEVVEVAPLDFSQASDFITGEYFKWGCENGVSKVLEARFAAATDDKEKISCGKETAADIEEYTRKWQGYLSRQSSMAEKAVTGYVDLRSKISSSNKYSELRLISVEISLQSGSWEFALNREEAARLAIRKIDDSEKQNPFPPPLQLTP